MGKLLVPIVLGLCAFLWQMHEKLDMGRTVYNHRPGVCRQVHGPVEGSEDIELIRSEGIAFVTSGVIYTKTNFEGKMFLYDFHQKLGADKLIAEELPIKGKSFDQDKFHPHGLSHWVVNGIIRLYVINHDEDFKHSVEIFDFDPSGPALIHKNTIKHPTLVKPNDLVAVGPDQFIFTNDGVAQSELGIMFESLSGYRGGSVYFWDGNESHQLLSGMGGPNGIAYDSRNNKLFVIEINLKRINAYDLSKDKNTATHLSTIDLYSACDNLFIDHDGSIYVGCHPVVLELVKSASDCHGDTTAPSQILRVKYDKDYKTAAVSEPYANDGKEVSASSVSVIYNNQMLIGTICKGLLHCEITDPSVL